MRMLRRGLADLRALAPTSLSLLASASGVVLLSAGLLGSPGCSKPGPPQTLSQADSLAIVEENRSHRASVDSFFVYDPGSPFKRDSSITYTGIKWYPIDPRYTVRSVIHRYATPDTVDVMGTKGERRRQLKYGYLAFSLPDTNGAPVPVRLNVYKFTPYDGKRYALFRNHLSVWFTDPTTGVETYHVGRYVDAGVEQPDPDHVYVIDFNKAYSPYCSYSNLYSCAIPREEDRVPVPVRAGELSYHAEH
jgi:uncharacterized protein